MRKSQGMPTMGGRFFMTLAYHEGRNRNWAPVEGSPCPLFLALSRKWTLLVAKDEQRARQVRTALHVAQRDCGGKALGVNHGPLPQFQRLLGKDDGNVPLRVA